MARAGRNRALVVREPNGRASRAAERDDPMATVRAQRLRCGATLENFRAQEFSTLLGRLYMAGLFDLNEDNPERAKERYEAGVWYRGLWLNMRRAIEAPLPYARAPGSPSGPGLPMDADDARRAIAKEHRALMCVEPSARKVLYAVVVQEVETMHDYWLAPLTGALDDLADHRAGQ